MDEGANANRAVGADLGSTRLESAILLRLALDQGLMIENTFVPKGGQGRLGDVDSIVENPLAHPDTDQPPEYGQERRAIEKVEEVDRVQLPDALDPPEARVVDGADARRWRAELFEATFHYGVVDRCDDRAEREQQSHGRVCKHPFEEFDRSQVNEHDEEDPKPTGQEKDSDCPKVEPILRGKPADERLPGPEMVVSTVAFDRARNLDGWRAQ